MRRSICFLFFFLINHALIYSESDVCPNGRLALYTFDVNTFHISAHCPTSGQPCSNRRGKCTEQNLCCPATLKMSSRSRLYDRLTNIRFDRLGEDYNHTYRLFELILSTTKSSDEINHDRWMFFDYTLRDLFEMPEARFFYSIQNCMQNHGIAYAFVPLNATSVTANISAMTILTRKNNSMDSIYICYMATRREHRRRGLATRLLQQIIHRALNERSNGVRSIILSVNTLNTAALQLYERCGWRCYAYLPGFLDPDPYHATNHAYQLYLRLDNVRNITNLCRESTAIDIEPLDDERSIQICGRTPVQF